MTFAPASTPVVVVDYGQALFGVGYACVTVSSHHDGRTIRTKLGAESVMFKHSRN